MNGKVLNSQKSRDWMKAVALLQWDTSHMTVAAWLRESVRQAQEYDLGFRNLDEKGTDRELPENPTREKAASAGVNQIEWALEAAGTILDRGPEIDRFQRNALATWKDKSLSEQDKAETLSEELAEVLSWDHNWEPE